MLVTAAFAVMTFFTASAQGIGSSRFGAVGGFTSSSADVDVLSAESYSLYHAGVAFQLHLGAGFCIQPELLYQVKGVQLSSALTGEVDGPALDLKSKVGYLELPVQLQWGPDLLAFRPYVFAEPFVGYAVNLNTKVGTLESKDFRKAAVDRLEYGLGLGAGIEFWRLQVSARYFWNFGSLYSESGEVDAIGQTVKTAFTEGKNFNGVSVSAAFFF